MSLPDAPLQPAPEPFTPWQRHALALVACLLALLIALPLRESLDLANTVMLFLLAVVVVAARLGRNAAVLASVVGVALFDFFFVPPRFSFAVSQSQYLVTFAVMLAVSLIVGHLTARYREQAQDARLRENTASALYGLARELAGALVRSQVDDALQAFVLNHTGSRARLLLMSRDETLAPLPGDNRPIDEFELHHARMVYESGHPIHSTVGEEAGWATDYFPLSGATRRRGVLIVTWPEGSADGPALRPLFEALASLVTTAIERIHFVEVAQGAQLEAEGERLRSSILSALSHDVRTPLTALYGLADTLLLAQPPLPPPQHDTASAIRDQALRLNDMVAKLLDMARLQAGKLSLHKEWQPLEEVVGASLTLLEPALAGHPVTVKGLDELPLVEVDAVLLERVLCNLLENAAKYSPPDTPIQLSARAAETIVEVRVSNAGAGFPESGLERVFELFERGEPSGVPGVGVGLAICRTIVEAHGGSIRAFNPDGGGACVAFTLPVGSPPAIEPESMPAAEGEAS